MSRYERKSKRDEINDRGGRGDDAEESSASRDIVARSPIHNRYEDRFSLKGIKIPDGVVYRWTRLTVTGFEDMGNQEQAYDQGWTPVPADRHPELLVKSFLHRRQEESYGNVIIRGGQLLMERDKELDRREKLRLHEYNISTTESLPALAQNTGFSTFQNKTTGGSFRGESGIGNIQFQD